MKSVMSHQFSQVPRADIPRSSFDRSHGYKTTFDSGYLVPIFLDEVLPGDTLNLRMSAFARLATPIFPFMDNVFLDTFFFFVPNRLVWNNWNKFNGEQEDPGDSTDYLIPILDSEIVPFTPLSMMDYFGIPTGVSSLEVSALPFRCYNLIWNEWFRDQNLQDSLQFSKLDGPDSPGWYPLQRRGKRHDYFTSALPWPQKGPAVTLPLGGQAPVYGQALNAGATNYNVWQVKPPTARRIGRVDINNQGYAADPSGLFGSSSLADPTTTSSGLSLGTEADYDLYPGTLPPYADLSEATAVTINDLREAFQLQKLYERDARGGTRYTEIIRAHFGVTSPDARLQRPEYLGGNSTAVNIHPIAQTSETSDGSPQGNLAAMGTVSSHGAGFTYSATEHGYIIGLTSVRADLNYQQGLNRLFSRRTRFDFYWPALSHLGEQAILNKEIYAQGTSQDDEVFGYQERYAEYRYKPSLITGKFRSNDPQSLDQWHLAQDFADLPVLGPTFIQENPPLERVIAVPTEPQFLFDSYFKYKCARPMPVYSVPGLVDHF